MASLEIIMVKIVGPCDGTCPNMWDSHRLSLHHSMFYPSNCLSLIEKEDIGVCVSPLAY